MARIVGVLLLAMAAGQVSNVAGFVEILRDYRVGDTVVSAVLALVLLAGEVAAGVGLLRSGTRQRTAAATAAVGVVALWSVLAVQAFGRGLVVANCGCFGVHVGQELRWWVLIEDAGLLAVALLVRYRHARATTPEESPSLVVGPRCDCDSQARWPDRCWLGSGGGSSGTSDNPDADSSTVEQVVFTPREDVASALDRREARDIEP